MGFPPAPPQPSLPEEDKATQAAFGCLLTMVPAIVILVLDPPLGAILVVLVMIGALLIRMGPVVGPPRE